MHALVDGRRIWMRADKQVTYRRMAQGSQNRWEPVRFDRFPVEPVRSGTRTGPVPTLIHERGKPVRFTPSREPVF
jgi:hypothetical protein